MIFDVTKENFSEAVVNSDKVVLLDFHASWCGPCRMLAPVIEEIADENENISVGKINVDEQPELASFFNISSIPTLVVIKNGKNVNSSVGYTSKENIVALLDV